MTETVSFTVSDIPPTDDGDNSQPNDAGTTNDLVCLSCGKPLVYSGRGRYPKYCDEHRVSGSRSGGATRGVGTRRSGRDVDAALAALDASHTSLSFLFMLLAPEAASAWEVQRPALDDRNRRILESDPALAKRLANVAAKGGAPALVISHLIAVAPAAAIATRTFRHGQQERRAARQAQMQAEESEYYEDTENTLQDLFAQRAGQ